MATLAASEQWFESYLTNHDLAFVSHPTLPGSNRKPDYQVIVGNDSVLCEVSEL